METRKLRAKSFGLDGRFCGRARHHRCAPRHGTVIEALLKAFDLQELGGADLRRQPWSSASADGRSPLL
jgi:hypothetical protein